VIRRHRFPLAFLALVAAMLFVAPLAKREVFQFRDHLDYIQPLRWFTALELREGRLPLWNPYSASGEPWLANPQTGVFYPPTWIFLVLPFATAYMLFLLFHLVVLAWGSYLLLERQNARGAAMVGAAAILLSGPVLSLVDTANNLQTLAWIPFALWCAAEGAWRRGGVVLALAFLAGEPFFAALAALLYVVIRRHRDVLGTAIVAFGLSAVQLLPFLEMVRGSDRTGGMDAQQILHDSMTPREWLRVVLPPPLIDAPPSQWFIPVAYGGVVVALLAIAGLTTLRRRRDVAAWLLLLAGAVLVSTGPELLTRLPVTLFRYPSRLVPLAMLAIGALAAAGWNRLRADKRWLDLLVIGVLAADLLPRAVVLLQSGRFDPRIVPFDRSIGAAHKFLSVHVDARRRVESIGGYLNLYDRRFDAFTGAPLVSRSYLAAYIELQSRPTKEKLDAAAVGWVVTTRAMQPPLERAGEAGAVRVYALPSPRAMAVSVSSARVTPLTWEMSTSHARVTVDAKEASTVTIAQQDGPGWDVTVDGKRGEKRLFSGVFRAVRVPPGRHEIVWTYRPKSIFAGGVMTLVTLFTMTLLPFVKRRR
jgi:hypothetical protein